MSQTSARLLYLHPHQGANDPVTLHEGPVTVNHARGSAVADGALALRWLPSTGLRLEVDGLPIGAPQPGERVEADVERRQSDLPPAALYLRYPRLLSPMTLR